MSLDSQSKTNIDIKTPRNVHLRAFYKRSFAFYTVKERLPVIVTQTIDGLVRKKEEILQKFGKEASEELKNILGELSKLKYEIQTNKPFRNILSVNPDAEVYNNYIKEQTPEDGHPSYFNSIWLFTECYMYRRIREAFELTRTLNTYDPFKSKKEESFQSAITTCIETGSYLFSLLNNKQCGANKEDFINLLKINLWGNKCDLSLSLGAVKASAISELSSIKQLEPNILCDHSTEVWKAVSNKQCNSDIVDIVFDNAGYELFTDLCIADFMISKKLVSKIRFYVKTIPWFISDTMKPDLIWFLDQLCNNENSVLKELGERWKNYFDKEIWTIEEHAFWTLPVDFSLMAKYNPKLYKKLSQAKLVIFKGDLNYRKLLAETNWDPVTPFEEALCGFNPSKLCTLRTLKADIICNLKPGLAELMDGKDEQWLLSGNYGVIQFCDKIKTI